MNIHEYFNEVQEYIKKNIKNPNEINSIIKELEKDNLQAVVNKDYNNNVSIEECGKKIIKSTDIKGGIYMNETDKLDGDRALNKMERKILNYNDFINEKLNIEYLIERSISKIKSYNLEDVNEYDEEELLELFKLLYELEYKYHKILNSKFFGIIERKENIIKIIENKSKKVIELLAETFIIVFEDWLNNHDYNNPICVGENRLEYSDVSEMLDYICSEYNWFLYDDRMSDSRKNTIKRSIMIDINNNPDKYPYVVKELSNNSEKSYMENELYNGVEEFNSIYGTEFETEEEAQEYIDNYESDIISDTFQLESLSKECYFEIYGNFVLPVMYDAFPSLQDVVDDNKELVENLKNISKLSLNKQFVELNIAINAVHSNGDMMDFYESRYSISKTDLDDLSNQNISEWNDDLNFIGVDIKNN